MKGIRYNKQTSLFQSHECPDSNADWQEAFSCLTLMYPSTCVVHARLYNNLHPAYAGAVLIASSSHPFMHGGSHRQTQPRRFQLASTSGAGSAEAARRGRRMCPFQLQWGRGSRRATHRWRRWRSWTVGSEGRVAALSGGSWRRTRGGCAWARPGARGECGRPL